MNILYINHYAGSPKMGMEFRPYYLSREWIKMGHKVTIIAADYSHLRILNPEINGDFEIEKIDEIDYCWVRTEQYTSNGIKRAITMGKFVWKLFVNAEKIANNIKPDVIITSSTYPLDTYAGQRIKKFCNKRTVLIHEIHDMWPITPMEMAGMSKYHPFIIMMQLAENSFCRNSDYVVSLLPCAKEYLINHGMKSHKFKHIPNGIVLEEWREKRDLPLSLLSMLKELKSNSKFLLCFFGSHTKSYALDYLIEAIKKIDNTIVSLLFVGNGFDKKRLQEMANNQTNILFHDSIPKECIPTLLDYVDGLYVGAVNNKMLRFGICMNKLFDSMMSGKPILYAVNAPNNYIRDYNCGITVEPENIQELIQGIEQLTSLTQEQRELLGNNGRNAIMKHFTYEVLAREFSYLFKAAK